MFVSAPVSEVVLKIVELVRGWPEGLAAQDGALAGTTNDFRAFIDRFLDAAPWSGVERDGVSLLFLAEGRGLTFASSLESRTLTQWFALEDAEFLVRVIDDRALVIHFHPI